MFPPVDWSFPDLPPTSFCERIWKHPHDGEDFTFTIDELTMNADGTAALFEEFQVNVFYLIQAMPGRWSDNNYGYAWRGAHMASIANIVTPGFACNRCEEEKITCYRSSKGLG